jgi:hypothetical protein
LLLPVALRLLVVLPVRGLQLLLLLLLLRVLLRRAW